MGGNSMTLFDLSQYETPVPIEHFEFIEHQPPAQPIAALNYLPTSTKTKNPRRNYNSAKVEN
jgi:hypothetical protein